MAIKVPQSSFAGGEIDPVLHERTTLNKYASGLKTARNVIVTKVGSICSRMGRRHVRSAFYSGKSIKCYSPPGTGYLFEFGDLHFRLWDDTGALITNTATVFTEAMLPDLKFETSGEDVYVFRDGVEGNYKINYTTGAQSDLTSFSAAATNGTVTATGAPTGYFVDYAMTVVRSGQESSIPLVVPGASTYKLPIAAGQSNSIEARVHATSATGITEMRVYRRPQNGGAYGYIGSTSHIYTPSGTLKNMVFTDLGGDADYSHQPPDAPYGVPPPVLGSSGFTSYGAKVGIVYQQRLIQTLAGTETIMASRPGYQGDFYRDFPYNSSSGLTLKAGSSGSAEVLDLIDSDGLVVFTKQGVFVHSGEITPENLSLIKRAKNVIKEDVPPKSIPGGVIFVDTSTNTIRVLNFSTEMNTYNAQEVSTFSNHLFFGREVTSWAFQVGNFPLLWVTFDDGTFASFTYEADQEMKAWTRHDSTGVLVEQVIETGVADLTYFVVNKDGNRYIESTIPRWYSATDASTNPEIDKYENIALMDGAVSTYTLLNDLLVGTDVFAFSPIDPGDPSADLVLTCGTSAIFTSGAGDPGDPGYVMRMFDDDGAGYTFTVMHRANDNQVTVRPDSDYPFGDPTTVRLYKGYVAVSGLSHLEGEEVSVIVDGYVISSPYNDVEGLPTTYVTAGAITLPDGLVGAIIHVGRPIIADVETLDITTVEQAPTVIESMTVNKLYVKLYKSRGIYLAHKFSKNDLVTDMQLIDQFDIDYEDLNPIIANRYQAPFTKRHEIMLPGDWSSNGKIAIRQVDPLHFEILSIIPDLEVLGRSDR